MVMHDHLNVIRLNDLELMNVKGGAISASFISAFTTALKSIYGFGQGFGGAVRRIITRNLCKF